MRPRAVVFLFSCSGTVACSSLLGDFSVTGESTGTGPLPMADAGRGESGPDAGAFLPSPTVHAVASGAQVYVGQPAVLDASQSTTTRGTLAFAWTVDTMTLPAGSRVTTASLSRPSSPTASFVPDVAGSYTLQVTASALGSSDTRSVTVIGVSPQVLFAQGFAGSSRVDGGATLSYVLSNLDGGGAHPVLCADAVVGAPGQGAPYAAFAGRAYDYWEAPPGQASEYAGFTIESVGDAGALTAHLWAGASTSTCAAPPADLGTMRFGPGRPWGSEPHFKPDGTRFVVFDERWRIVTYAADGSGGSASARVVATYPVPYGQASSVLDPVGVETLAGYVFEPPRVTWTASGLAWAQPTQDGWEIVTAPDTANATLSTYMKCPGVTPREIAMLADGTVIASYRESAQSSENLFQLKPDAQRNCIHEQPYTHLADAGSSMATDFAVSPDGTQIAFLQIDTTGQDASAWLQGNSQLPGGYLYVVPVTGGTPTLVSGDPALYGPRWVAGGAALVFTRLDGVVGGTSALATSIVVVSPDGGGKRAIAQGDGVNTFVSTSGNAACSASRAGAGPGSGAPAGALWLVPAIVAWARSRSRRWGQVLSRPGHHRR